MKITELQNHASYFLTFFKKKKKTNKNITLSPTALISHELSSSPLAKFFAAPLTRGEKLGKA